MTDHQRFEGLLADFGCGSLRGSEHEEVKAHVESCPDCRQWVEAYQDLAAAVGSPSEVALKHPESDELARYAVDRAGHTGEEQARLAHHLGECIACRQDIELVESAVTRSREATGKSSGRARVPRFGWGEGRFRRFALAATILLAIVTSAVFLLSPRGSSSRDIEISSQSLGGEKLVETDGTITATAVAIEAESAVDFRAGESVVLGNGFSVADGAFFSVEITGDHDDSSEREKSTS